MPQEQEPVGKNNDNLDALKKQLDAVLQERLKMKRQSLAVPQPLESLKIWALRIKLRDDYQFINVKTGKIASASDPSTLCTYLDVVCTWNKLPLDKKLTSHIAFAVGNGIIAVNLLHCRSSNGHSSTADDILKCLNGYSAVSFNETGMYVVVRIDKTFDLKNKFLKIPTLEYPSGDATVFTKGYFIIHTGQQLEGYETSVVPDRTIDLLEWYNRAKNLWLKVKNPRHVPITISEEMLEHRFVDETDKEPIPYLRMEQIRGLLKEEYLLILDGEWMNNDELYERFKGRQHAAEMKLANELALLRCKCTGTEIMKLLKDAGQAADDPTPRKYGYYPRTVRKAFENYDDVMKGKKRR